MGSVDAADHRWYFRDMMRANGAIPAYGLYGGNRLFPDLMHCERIADRAPLHGGTIRPHRHTGIHQFLLILDSAASASLDGRTLAIERSMLLSVPRWTVHGFRFPNRARGYVLSVLPETLPELFDGCRVTRTALDTWTAAGVESGTEANLSSAFEGIIEELAGTDTLRDAVLRARAVEIVARLVRSARRDSGTATNGAAAGHVERFESLVRRHFRDRWRVRDYARALTLSPKHLGRVVQAATGRTPAQLIEARVLHEARTSLAYTRRPISQIAYALGYTDPAYFARAFRRVEGVSPSLYRATCSSEVGESRAGSATGTSRGES